MAVVTKDTTKGWCIPQSTAEYTSFLTGTGISNPAYLWLCQEVSGNLTDSIGAAVLTAANAPSYQTAVTGWSSKAISWADASASRFDTTAVPNGSTSSLMLFGYFYVAATPAANRYMASMTDYAVSIAVNSTGKLVGSDNAVVAGTETITDGAVRPCVMVYSRAALTCKLFYRRADGVIETIDAAYASSAGAHIVLGAYPTLTTPAGGCLYAAQWTGVSAELTATQATTLLDRFVNGPAYASIAVTPGTASIAPAATQALVATGTRVDASTATITTIATWTSSNAAVATVSSTGVVTAVAVGTATITATYTSLNATAATGTMTITVTGGTTLTVVNVTPVTFGIGIGDTIALTATGTYSNASTADVTATSTWTSDTPSVATVSASGVVTGIHAGTAGISATISSHSGSATATIVDRSLDENEHHPWPGVARGLWDFNGTQVVWTGDRVMVARPNNSSLGSSAFWHRNVADSTLMKRGIPAYLPLQTDFVPPITGQGSAAYVDSCLTDQYRVVISASSLGVEINILDRTTGVLINRSTFAGSAPINPRVVRSGGNLMALWMTGSNSTLVTSTWVGDRWTNQSTLSVAVSCYDIALTFDGFYIVWATVNSGTDIQLGRYVGSSASSFPFTFGMLLAHTATVTSIALSVAPNGGFSYAWLVGNTLQVYTYTDPVRMSDPAKATVATIDINADPFGGLSLCSRGLRNSVGEYEYVIHYKRLTGPACITSTTFTAGPSAQIEQRHNTTWVTKSFRVGDEVFAWARESNANTLYLLGGQYQSQVCGFADREDGFLAPQDINGTWLAQVAPYASGDGTGPFTVKKVGGVGGGVWDAEVISVQSFAKDGYVEFSPIDTSLQCVLGLSTTNTNSVWSTVGYGIILDGFDGVRFRFRVIENAVAKYTGTYALYDVFRVTRYNGSISYQQNGTTVYTSLQSTVVPLIVDSSFNDVSSGFTNVSLVDKGVAVAVSWATKNVAQYSLRSGFGPTQTGSKFMWARQFITGQPYAHPGNIRLGDTEFLPTISTAAYGKSVYVSGSAVRCWDGSELGDAGFQSYPKIASIVPGAGGSLTASINYYVLTRAVRYNKQGERFESGALVAPGTLTTGTNKLLNLVINTVPCTNHSDVVIEVFRTEGGGTTFYLEGVVANSLTAPTVSFTCTMSDAVLRLQTADPHETGVGQAKEIESFGPVGCSIIVNGGDRLWGAGGQVPPGVVQFSKLHNDGFGAGFDDLAGTQEIDTEGGVITSLLRLNDAAIVAFEAQRLFVIGGYGPDNKGNGAFNVPQIVLSDGATTHLGTILTPLGGVFWGDGGPRLITPSYEVVNISVPVQPLSSTLMPSGVRLDLGYQEVVWYTAAGDALLWNFLGGNSRWARWNNLFVAAASPLALVTTNAKVLYQNANVAGDGGEEFEFRLRSGLLQAQKVIGGGTFFRNVGITGYYLGSHSVRFRFYYDGSPCWTEQWIWQPDVNTGLTSIALLALLTPVQVDALGLVNQAGIYMAHNRVARNECAYLQIEISDTGAANKTFVPTELTLEIGVSPNLARVSPGAYKN
jgi:hypothetical protein